MSMPRAERLRGSGRIPDTLPYARGMRRIVLALAAAATVVAGLAVHALAPLTFAGDFSADALYAVLISLLVALVLPRSPSWVPAIVAAAWCAGVEALQLTGLPEQWGLAWRPLMLVFGTVYSWWDLLAYAVGIAAVFVADSLIRMARPRAAGRDLS